MHRMIAFLCQYPVAGLLTCVLLSAAGGCGESGAETETAEQRVLILAAASTQDALEQVAKELRERGGPRLTVSPASSNALAQQIIAGAPGDLFLSANPAWADEVAKHGHAVDTLPLLSGQLVLVVPAGNPANVKGLNDLFGKRVRRVALAGEQVPAGKYAEQALRTRDLFEPLLESGRIVRGQNVRFTLAYVERGEAEAGIVYASDAAVSSNVQIVFTFNPEDHEPIVYPLALLKHGQDRPAVREVFEYLQSPETGAIFKQFGFAPTIGEIRKAANPPRIVPGLESLWLSPPEWQAIRLSLLVAIVAALCSLPPATLLAWWLTRRDFPGKAAIETLLNLPLVLPPVVTGYLLLVALGRQGWLGRLLDQWLDIQIVFTWRAAALASGVIAFPLMVRAIRVAMLGLDARLEQAARTLGAHPLRVFFTVTLPLARHGLIAGAILGFARSIGEFGATIMIAGSIPGETRTMPLYIFAAIESPDGIARAQQMVIVSILIAAAAMIVGEVVERRARMQGPMS